MARFFTIVAFLLISVTSGLVRANANPCIVAADRAARTTGVPLSVMRAVTLAETGRGGPGGFAPWPWAIQTGGKGAWFDTATEALGFATARIASGVENLDLGCFQLNYAWHGKAFESIAEMLDPQANADYAAAFLEKLHDESGDWRVAVGRFHSRNRDLAEPYITRLKTIYLAQANTDQTPPSEESEPPPPVLTRTLHQRSGTPFVSLARGPLIEARAQPLIGNR